MRVPPPESARASDVPNAAPAPPKTERRPGAAPVRIESRVAPFSVEGLHALHLALIEQFGENAPDILYRSGYDWALRDMVRFKAELQEQLGGRTELWDLDTKFILDAWWARLAAAGWGHSTFDCTALSRGVVLVELRGSTVGPAFAATDQPACHLYAGLYAGAFSFFERAERHAAELQCIACGATSCLFAIGPGADIDAAETWRQQGLSAAELTRRLR